jgi:argininosuccinate lyase
MMTKLPSPARQDNSVFPNSVYKDTVLAPLFEGAKANFVEPVQRINRAHLVMLAETGILNRDRAAEIANALVQIDRDLDIDSLTYTGEVEDFFFLVEAELTKRLGADRAGRLHTARSRNDIDHTIFRIKLKQKLDALLKLAHQLAQALVDTAEREKTTLIVAYTHGQPAQPSTFGHYLSAAIEVLLGDIDRLHNARAALDLCPMGAAAITTTGFAIDRHRVCELLGFAAPKENAYGCIASIDYMTGLYSALKLLFLHLGRVFQDFQQWSSFEVGQLHVPNEFVQISSIMPQKRNPVPIEHLRLLSSLTVGRCDMVVNTMHNTPFTDMNDSEGEVQVSGYAAFESGGRVLSLIGALVPALRIETTRVRANIDNSCITVTELADTLVREADLSFRQAHEIAAHTARSVIADGLTLDRGYPAFTSGYVAATGSAPPMAEIRFKEVVSPENFVAIRERFGGPGSIALSDALSRYRADLDRYVSSGSRNATHERSANETLLRAFNALQGQ